MAPDVSFLNGCQQDVGVPEGVEKNVAGIGLHVVWPWTKELMRVMSPSLFCDATYKVTLYKYKVVAITTLDGNKHHRPLMVSFILKSNGKTWSLIFDMFYR